MEYRKVITMKDGRECVLRNGTPEDARAVLDNFILTHAETEFLSSYPDEITLTEEKETAFLKARAESENEIEIIAVVDGHVAGTAGVARVGGYEKVRHRASFGISVEKACWGLGIGRALLRACVECARRAGYRQLELEAVAENARALALYRSEGFTEYGRNPLGFHAREMGWQPLVLMRLDLAAADEPVLAEPAPEYDAQIRAYRRAFLETEGSMDGCGSLRRFERTEDWLAQVEALKRPETVPAGLVPSTQYMYVRPSDGKIVGMIQIRHCFNEYLEKYAGHIGYSVCPDEREKGYATRMLRAVLPKCRELGLDKVLVSCLSDNEASRRTILRCGGVYESTVFEPEKKVYLERYWIDTAPGKSEGAAT